MENSSQNMLLNQAKMQTRLHGNFTKGFPAAAERSSCRLPINPRRANKPYLLAKARSSVIHVCCKQEKGGVGVYGAKSRTKVLLI